MDQEQLKQIIAEYFVKLPKEAQDVFSSLVWLEKLKMMGDKYVLNEKQIEFLGTETTLVLLGMVHVNEYRETIAREIGLRGEFLEKLMADIDENILKTIKDQLVETYKLNLETSAEEEIITNEKEKVNIVRNYEPIRSRDGLDRFPSRSWEEKIITNEDSSKEQVVSSMEDEIPLPPYGISSKEQVVSSKVGESSKEYVESSMGNAEKEMPKNIIEEKLRGATTSDQIVSDYSSKTSDPYREKP